MEPNKIEEQFKAALDGLAAQKKTVDDFIAAQEKLSKEGKETVASAVKFGEENAAQLEKAVARIKDIEQQVAEGIKAGKTEVKQSFGELFAASEQVKKFFEGSQARARLEVKTADVMNKNTIVNTDSTTAPQRVVGVIPGARDRLTALDLIPSLNTTANVIEHTREATFTNSAAETAEGSAKPQSALTFELVTTNIATIATFLKISKQLASDAPSLASYINARLAYAVEKRRDQQIIIGDGTTPNVSGITDSGNFTAFTPTSVITTKLDGIAAMAAQLETAGYYANGVMLNPADLWAINMLKDSTGQYVFGDPRQSPVAGPWGLATVSNVAVPLGKAIVADFFEAYQWWNRSNTVVEMFEQDEDNVQKNLITIRAELRGALETRIPAAVRYGSMMV